MLQVLDHQRPEMKSRDCRNADRLPKMQAVSAEDAKQLIVRPAFELVPILDPDRPFLTSIRNPGQMYELCLMLTTRGTVIKGKTFPTLVRMQLDTLHNPNTYLRIRLHTYQFLAASSNCVKHLQR
jgi:hypothetical protein